MTTDQYRHAPIPADGRTIEAMRLALLDTPAGRAMTNAGDTRLYWMNESDAYMLMSPFINTTDEVLVRMAPAPDAGAQLVEAAVAEYFLEPPMQTPDEWVGRRSAIRGMMVRLELYKQFTEALAAMETSHDH